MSSRIRERAAAWFFAVIFVVSSSALTVALIISNIQSKNKQDNGAASQQTSQTTKKEGKMLQGTQLENFTPVTSISNLKTEDTVVGTGAEVENVNQKLTMDYTGAVAATGVIFQSSKDSGQPLTDYPLSSLIKGWQEGVPGMKVGGTRRLLIPAALAYGANPPQGSGIPANADLVFDMTLISIK